MCRRHDGDRSGFALHGPKSAERHVDDGRDHSVGSWSFRSAESKKKSSPHIAPVSAASSCRTATKPTPKKSPMTSKPSLRSSPHTGLVMLSPPHSSRSRGNRRTINLSSPKPTAVKPRKVGKQYQNQISGVVPILWCSSLCVLCGFRFVNFVFQTACKHRDHKERNTKDTNKKTEPRNTTTLGHYQISRPRVIF